MDWVKPQHSRTQVNRAGQIIAEPMTAEFDWGHFHDAFEIMQNWRAAHSFPLNTFQNALRRRAQSVGGSLIISQRLKRYPSIIKKLRRDQTSSLQLARMQDIGGCRVVLDSVEKAKTLSTMYSDPSSSRFPHELAGEGKNYIDNPKADGYRGIHLVYRYKGGSRTSAWDNLRIEIQIRSALQHAWAMAVETVDIFTGQALKSNEGDAEWKRFFLLMSAYIAYREKSPCCPGVSDDISVVLKEIIQIESDLNITERLSSYQTIVSVTDSGPHKEAGYHLIYLDFKSKEVSIESFNWNESEQANEKYAELERRHLNEPIVLVKSRSITGLRKAYPSFFLDSGPFIHLLKEAIMLGALI